MVAALAHAGRVSTARLRCRAGPPDHGFSLAALREIASPEICSRASMVRVAALDPYAALVVLMCHPRSHVHGEVEASSSLSKQLLLCRLCRCVACSLVLSRKPHCSAAATLASCKFTRLLRHSANCAAVKTRCKLHHCAAGLPRPLCSALVIGACSPMVTGEHELSSVANRGFRRESE